MAYILKNIGNVPNTPFYTFECDNSSDISQIPTEGISMGSRCYVINEGKEYALNSAGEWRLVPASGGGGTGGGDTPDTPTGPDIVYDGGDEDM